MTERAVPAWSMLTRECDRDDLAGRYIDTVADAANPQGRFDTDGVDDGSSSLTP